MKTKVTGYLTQKHGFYYVVLNLPTDEKGKRNRKTLSTGLSTDRNATKAKALLLTMIREANAGEEVRGVNERQPKSQNKTEDERWKCGEQDRCWFHIYCDHSLPHCIKG